MNPKRTTRKYYFSLIIWLLCILFTIAGYFSTSIMMVVPVIIMIFLSFGMFVVDISIQRRTLNSFIFDQIFAATPVAIKILASLSFLYTITNFVVNCIILSHGGPSLIDGVPYLQGHGVVHEISVPEYNHLLHAQTRLFSGHSLAFTALPLAYYSAKNQ